MEEVATGPIDELQQIIKENMIEIEINGDGNSA